MLKVSKDFVLSALKLRYQQVNTIYGGEAAHALWDNALTFFVAGAYLTGTPMSIVDNYLTNGDFIKRPADTPYPEWKAYCKANALFFNQDYACKSC